MGRLGLAILASASLFGAGASHATTVLIVRPTNPPASMLETLVRIRGELMSVGFATEIVDASTVDGAHGRESHGWLERLAELRGADAVVAMLGDDSPNSVEVWVVDKVTGKSVVRRVPFEPRSERAPEALAIRAIELLRSSFLEIDLAAAARPNEPNAAPPPAVVRFVEMAQTARPPDRFGVEVGVAAVMSLGGFGSAVLPLLRLDWALGSRFLAQASLAGLGSRPVVETAIGSAQVAQEYGVLGAGYRFRSGQRLRPFVALSAGVLHTSVDGRAGSPSNQGRDADLWSFLVDAGLGTCLRLQERFYLSLAAHAHMAEPYPAIRFLDGVVATSARPNLLLTLTLGAWL